MEMNSADECGCGTKLPGGLALLDDFQLSQIRRRIRELGGGASPSSGVTALPGFMGTGDPSNGSARTFGDILFRLPDGETFRLI